MATVNLRHDRLKLALVRASPEGDKVGRDDLESRRRCKKGEDARLAKDRQALKDLAAPKDTAGMRPVRGGLSTSLR